MKYQNREIREEIQENIDSRITLDDFTQYAPTAAAYSLNLCGIKSRHGYGGLTVISGTAYALMGTAVYVMKDVIAGAGIGIFAYRLQYWLYPVMSGMLFRKRHTGSTYVSPYVSAESKGLSYIVVF